MKTSVIVLWVVCIVSTLSCDTSLPQSQDNPPVLKHESERWECYEFFGSTKLGILTADNYGASGTVDFAGIVTSAQFSIQGIERRWDWGLTTDGHFEYAIVISPDGKGSYYNFRTSEGEPTKSREVFRCERVDSPTSP